MNQKRDGKDRRKIERRKSSKDEIKVASTEEKKKKIRTRTTERRMSQKRQAERRKSSVYDDPECYGIITSSGDGNYFSNNAI